MYDALIVVSFGGPEGPDDIEPFLDRVLRGRPVPERRRRDVVEHYRKVGGVSPLNEANRRLVAAVRDLLRREGPDLPVYWGNRNWHPLLPETLRRMRDDGIGRALAFVTSAFSSWSGCRQYLEDIEGARAQVSGAPVVDKLRVFFDHPGFIEPWAHRVRMAMAGLPADQRQDAIVLYTAHSLPLSMARGCDYEAQLRAAARLVAQRAGVSDYTLAYQSRSGRPDTPWLGPDVLEQLEALARAGVRDVVVVPIGFVADHMEVCYDLDVEAAERAAALGIDYTRVETVGTAAGFVAMVRELMLERLDPGRERRALSALGIRPDCCPADCCPRGA